MNYSWPSMKAKKLRALLRGLGYHKVRGQGSHEVLHAEGRPRIVYAFHSSATIPGGLVRNILVKQAGLTLDEAKEVVENG